MRTHIRFVRTHKILSAILLMAATFFAASQASAFNSPYNNFTGAIEPNAQPINTWQPLTVAGITSGQTARINVHNVQSPDSELPPDPCAVELAFRDENGNVLADRSGRLFHKSAVINPFGFDSLELDGSLVAPTGSRVTLIPCIKIVRLSGGAHVLPTFEGYDNRTGRNAHLSPGVLKGFNAQFGPTKPVDFGLVGIVHGQTLRINAINMEDPISTLPPGPCTVEMTFFGTDGRPILDRSGQPVHKIVELHPGQSDSLDLNANEIVRTAGVRVHIHPSITVHVRSEGSLIGASTELMHNDNKKTTVHANWAH